MKTIIFYLLTFIIALSCSKNNEDSGTPKCIDDKISNFKANLVCDKSQVTQYIFQGKTVFVFENAVCCCDFTSEVVDNECKILGSLGGIAGFYEINGEDFSKKATFIRVVWKK